MQMYSRLNAIGCLFPAITQQELAAPIVIASVIVLSLKRLTTIFFVPLHLVCILQ